MRDDRQYLDILIRLYTFEKSLYNIVILNIKAVNESE